MNLELLNPFDNDYPEDITGCLAEGFATTLAFNRLGTLLAAGCNDGRCVIWDFDTQGAASIVVGHSQPITSVSWSWDGRKLLTSSTDWKVVLWDLTTITKECEVRFDAPVMHAQIHPKQPDLCLVCPLLSKPMLVNVRTGEKHVLDSEGDGEGDGTEGDGDGASSGGPNDGKLEHHSVATFGGKNGDIIYTGNAHGVLAEIDTETRKVVRTTLTGSNTAIKDIQLSSMGLYLLVNCADRVVRIYTTADMELAHSLQDAVNKVQWKRCCFSGNAEFVVGGSSENGNGHELYVWDRTSGALVKMLEGPKEGILDLAWHPTRPVITSCSSNGLVYIWGANCTQNWSAFAPEFTELEENEVYIEREDEFDRAEPGGGRGGAGGLPEDTDAEIDVVGIDDDDDGERGGNGNGKGKGGRAGGAAGGDADCLFFLPTIPIPDASMGVSLEGSGAAGSVAGPAATATTATATATATTTTTATSASTTNSSSVAGGAGSGAGGSGQNGGAASSKRGGKRSAGNTRARTSGSTDAGTGGGGDGGASRKRSGSGSAPQAKRPRAE